MTQVVKQSGFASHSAPEAPAIKTLLLITAILAYAAGFVLLYPLAAESMAKSEAAGESPAPIQFVGP